MFTACYVSQRNNLLCVDDEKCRGWVHTCEPRSHGQTDRREIISIKTNKQINPCKQCNIGFISPSSITKQFYPSITQHKASRLGLFNIWLFIRTMQWVVILRGFFPQGGTLNNNWLDSSALPGRGESSSQSIKYFSPLSKYFKFWQTFFLIWLCQTRGSRKFQEFLNFLSLTSQMYSAAGKWMNKQSSVSSFTITINQIRIQGSNT